MKLYYTPGACPLSPHIVLEEAGLPYTLIKVDLKTKIMEDGGNYLTVNPKGYVPALVLDNDELLTEGPAIVQYLADLVPEKKLVPANGSMARYRLQEWLTFIGVELHKNFSPLFNPSASDDWKTAARANLDRRLGFANQSLAGKAYLLGEFSVADAYLFTVLTWADRMKVDLTPFPNLQAFFARMEARPAVQAALKAQGLR